MEKSNCDSDEIKMIVGLGNPDEEYKNTYHNVGRLFLDELIKKAGGKSIYKFPNGKDFGFIKIRNFVLVVSKTYMNESGLAVDQALKYFKNKPKEMIVVHDDSDKEIGTYKKTFAQSSGGHKGVESIIKIIESQDFYRIKIGIRPQEETIRKKASDFVLNKITKRDKEIFDKIFDEIINSINI